MVFSINTIESSMNNIFPVNESEYIIDDSSFFESALELNLEGYNLFLHTIWEEKIVGQKVSEEIEAVDPREAIILILKWFMSSYQMLYNKYEIYYRKFKKEIQQYEEYKEHLLRCRDIVRYGKEYYVFRNLDIDTSKTSYKTELQLRFDKLKNHIETIATICHSTPEVNGYEIDGYIVRLMSEFQNDELEFNVMRGRMTNNKEVTKEEFGASVFSFYRVDDSSIDQDQRKPGYIKNIDGVRIQQAAQSLFNLKDQNNLLLNEVTHCEKWVTATIKSIENYNFMYDVLPENTELHNAVCRDAIFKIKDICQMYILIFAGRLDACRQFNKINKDLIELRIKDMKKEAEDNGNK